MTFFCLATRATYTRDSKRARGKTQDENMPFMPEKALEALEIIDKSRVVKQFRCEVLAYIFTPRNALFDKMLFARSC